MLPKLTCINTTSAVPSRAYDGLINIKGDYVTVRDIKVQFSAGRGIALSKGYRNAIIENNTVYYTAGNSTILNRKTSENIVRNNDTSYCAAAWKNGDWIAVSKTWPTCNSAVNSHHNIFENNYIHESYGEGIVLLENSPYNIIRNNTLYAVRSANIYMDNSSNNIVENNMIIGDRDGEFSRGSLGDGHRYGGGISVKVESYPTMYNSINNIVRNNLLVRSLGLLMGLEPEAEAANKKVGVLFVNNTLVETGTYIQLNDNGSFYSPNTEIANNIFINSPLKNNACKVNVKVNIHHNIWSEFQNNANCKDSSGGLIGDPQITRTDWNNISKDNLPSSSDFSLLPNSLAINAGVYLNNQVFANQFYQSNYLSGNCQLDILPASYDFNCNKRQQNVDLGAVMFTGNKQAVVLPPSSLVIIKQ